MATTCARCGCDGESGIRRDACGATYCCCEATSSDAMAALAVSVKVAFEAADLSGIEALLSTDVHWGAPEQRVATCTNRGEVLRWYEAARDVGAQARVVETLILGRHLVIGMTVSGLPRAQRKKQPDVRWQVLSVTNGQVGEIRGYDTREEAENFVFSGTSHWHH